MEMFGIAHNCLFVYANFSLHPELNKLSGLLKATRAERRRQSALQHHWSETSQQKHLNAGVLVFVETNLWHL